MASSPTAFITGEVLRWARTSAGLVVADAAKKAGVSEAIYLGWERGTAHPSLAQLERVAKACRRPSAAFFLPAPPPEPQDPPDFRQLPEGITSEWSPQLRSFLRYVRTRQQWAREEREELGARFLGWVGSARLGQPVGQLAHAIRQHLGVSDVEQRSWHGPAAALAAWKAATERAGVLIFQSGIRREWVVEPLEMRGFALADPYAPAIALNGSDTLHGRIFTLIHEVVHLFVGRPGVSGWERPPLESAEAQPVSTEVQCNLTAAAVLLPAEALRSSVEAIGWNGAQMSPAEAETAIRDLARQFSVSRGALARRLLDLGLLDWEAHQEQHRRITDDWRRMREKRSSGGGPPPAIVAVARHGRAFSSLVLDAFAEGRLSASEFEAMVGLQVRHLPRLEEAAHQGTERQVDAEKEVA